MTQKSITSFFKTTDQVKLLAKSESPNKRKLEVNGAACTTEESEAKKSKVVASSNEMGGSPSKGRLEPAETHTQRSSETPSLCLPFGVSTTTANPEQGDAPAMRKTARKTTGSSFTKLRLKNPESRGQIPPLKPNSSGDSMPSDNPPDISDPRSPSRNVSRSPVPSSTKTEPLENAVPSMFSSGKKSTVDPNCSYDPSRDRYHPVDHATWKRSQDVPYMCLARTLAVIEDTSARLKITEILANYFRSVICLSPEELVHSIYLCLNKLAPDYAGIELNVGENIALKAIAQTTGRAMDKVKKSYAELGDVGVVAESSKTTQRTMFTPAPLTVKAVFRKLTEIANLTGSSSMTKKVEILKGMLVASKGCEARFVTRSITGKLRIGLAEQTVLAALGQAVTLTPPSTEFPPPKLNAGKGISSEKLKSVVEKNTLKLKSVYCECPNYEMVVSALLEHGIDSISEHCKLTPGIPLKPMLAHPTKGVDEIFKRFDKGDFVCEYKYDGERAQIHLCSDGHVKIFSRNSEDNTTKYPDIVDRMKSVIDKEKVESFVIDTEAVAWNPEKQQILPFQVLSTRKRKDADKSEIKVEVCVYAFDILFLNGESLVNLPLRERRERLRSSFTETPGTFVFATSMSTSDTDSISEFLDQSVKDSCEGLMVKSLDVDATYEIAKRSHSWLKLKKDYLEGIGDTLDLVVIGGYTGTGKRTGKYGGFLLACYDTDNEEFQSICKIGTGFKDEDLEIHSKFFSQDSSNVTSDPKSYYRFSDRLDKPDTWFEAVQVWEVKAADLSISPVHLAGVGLQDEEKGISLRFPRFIRVRDDKKPEEATSSQQVIEMYRNQQQIVNQRKTEKVADEDY